MIPPLPEPKICNDCGYTSWYLEDFIGHRIKAHRDKFKWMDGNFPLTTHNHLD